MFLFGKGGDGGKGDLHLAVRCGDKKLLAKRLRKDGAVHARDEHERTALHVACMLGNAEMVSALLQAGAKANVVDEEGKTPLMYAVLRSKIGCIRTLLENVCMGGSGDVGLDVQEPVDKLCCLHMCIAKGRGDRSEDALKLLLKHNCNLNLQTKDGKTPLMLACQQKLPLHAMRLIEAGTLVDITDAENRTAVMYAAENGLADVVHKLVVRKADLGVVASNGMTALDWARRADQQPCVDALMGLKKKNLDSPSPGSSPVLSKSSTSLHEVKLSSPSSRPGSNAPSPAVSRRLSRLLMNRQWSLPEDAQRTTSFGDQREGLALGRQPVDDAVLNPIEARMLRDEIRLQDDEARELMQLVSTLQAELADLASQLEAKELELERTKSLNSVQPEGGAPESPKAAQAQCVDAQAHAAVDALREQLGEATKTAHDMVDRHRREEEAWAAEREHTAKRVDQLESELARMQQEAKDTASLASQLQEANAQLRKELKTLAEASTNVQVPQPEPQQSGQWGQSGHVGHPGMFSAPKSEGSTPQQSTFDLLRRLGRGHKQVRSATGIQIQPQTDQQAQAQLAPSGANSQSSNVDAPPRVSPSAGDLSKLEGLELSAGGTLKPIRVRIQELAETLKQSNQVEETTQVPLAGVNDEDSATFLVSRQASRSRSMHFRTMQTANAETQFTIPSDVSDTTRKLLESQRQAIERRYAVQLDRLKRDKDAEISSLRARLADLQQGT